MKRASTGKTSPGTDFAKLKAQGDRAIDVSGMPYDARKRESVEKFFAKGMVRRPRGPQKAPTKVQVALRLDRDIVERLRASGEGWQTRLNELLRAAIGAFK
jgi:uncharacterized protein (DUF4415 family)